MATQKNSHRFEQLMVLGALDMPFSWGHCQFELFKCCNNAAVFDMDALLCAVSRSALQSHISCDDIKILRDKNVCSEDINMSLLCFPCIHFNDQTTLNIVCIFFCFILVLDLQLFSIRFKCNEIFECI